MPREGANTEVLLGGVGLSRRSSRLDLIFMHRLIIPMSAIEVVSLKRTNHEYIVVDMHVSAVFTLLMCSSPLLSPCLLLAVV